MRISSTGDVPRSDLAVLRRLVPALWAEWDALQFTADGRLRDPDTGDALSVLRLHEGRHRAPNARYFVDAGDGERWEFVLVADDGRTLRGTARGDQWQAELELGERSQLTGSLDVGAVLRANEVPGCLVALIGARPADGDATIVLPVLDQRGDLVQAQARAQRVRGALAAHVVARGSVWHSKITITVQGRGVLGRTALFVGRPFLRRALRQGLDEFWPDVVKEATNLQRELATLRDDVDAAGGTDAWLHRNLWEALRSAARDAG